MKEHKEAAVLPEAQGNTKEVWSPNMPDKQIDMYQDLYPEGRWYISESKKMTG